MRTGAVTMVAAVVLGLLTAVYAAVPARSTAFRAVGSAGQVYVTGLAPSALASLVSPAGRILKTERADSLGGLLFRDVVPGKGYRVRLGTTGAQSAPVTVHSDAAAPWDPGVYDQTVPDNGYSYLTTRDGTKLAIDVHPPTSPAGEPGLPAGTPLPEGPDYLPPYPTLIEYSGYGYADPSGPVNGIAVLANLMGFAVVDVNMRGTGCSGGAYDFFEPLQSLDGYDVVETIARQPWVLGHKVGMMGISYGAISQLFVAQLDPPHLAAISPLSTIDATATTLYPGGVLNTGFAVAWAEQRQHEAEPAGPNSGQPWAYQRVKAGDKTCLANQALHGEAANLRAKIAANSYYRPAVADPLDPVTFVHRIKVPVFMACQWEDEQTGGHCPDLVQHFTGTRRKWFTFTNGAHIDSLDPYTYDRWYDFLELFVAHQAPIGNAAVSRAAAPVIYQAALGTPKTDPITLPPDPVQSAPTYPAALAAFERLPEVRVLFDNGAGRSPTGASTPGDPYPGFEHGFSSFPVPGTIARTWYMGPGGALLDRPPARGGVDEYISNARALPLTDYGGNTGGGGLWGDASDWDWKWAQNPAGSAVSYVSGRLARDTTVVGGGAVVLWVRSSTPDVDLQATISEVRPDGNETYVQSGWLRASERALSRGSDNLFRQPSTELDPIPTFRQVDAAAMPPGQFVKVAVPLYYEGHVYRARSRIRVTIAAPNGAQPVWSFGDTVPRGTSDVSISFSKSAPSELVLPVVPGVSAPTPLPACPSVRNEPCRRYERIVNRVSAAPAYPLGSAPATRGPGTSATGRKTSSSWPPDVFAVGTFHGLPGNVTRTENVASIQLAVDDAEAWATRRSNEARCGGSPCDSFVLLAPGDYKTVPGAVEAPPAGQGPAGVLIDTANVWLVGMNRDSVVVDGTKSGPACSTNPRDQVYGPSAFAPSPFRSKNPYRPKDAYEGLNGVMVWRAGGTWVENLTVCNFLDGGDGTGNEIWWNGGAGSGQVFADRQGGYRGSYLTATSTFYAPSRNPYDPGPDAVGNPEVSAASYGIFSSDWNGGLWDQTYASNFNDSGYYIGACQDQCNQVVDRAWAENNALGYSGSNSGGRLVVENSQFDRNEDGFDSNSQNGDNPPPQNGACPAGVKPPVLTDPATGRVYQPATCWVFFHNFVHDNNNPDVPTYGSAAAGPVGTGLSLSGARNDTVLDNVFAHNDAWGTILVPYPDSGGPCTGGVLVPPAEIAPGGLCWYDESADAVIGNTYEDNGSWGNPTNGDIGATNLEPGATDCFSGNLDGMGLTTSPPEAELIYPRCTGATVPPDLNAPFTGEVACDSGNVSLVGPVTGATFCPPTIAGATPNYPRQTAVILRPLPGAKGLEDPSSTTLPTMPGVCESLLRAGMGTNPWCG